MAKRINKTVSSWTAGVAAFLLMTGLTFGHDSESAENETLRFEVKADAVGVFHGSPGFTGQFEDTGSPRLRHGIDTHDSVYGQPSQTPKSKLATEAKAEFA